MVRGLILGIVLMLSACAGKERVRIETVYVNVPVPLEYPAEKREYKLPAKPSFVSPTNKDAVVALTKEEAEKLRAQTFSFYKRMCELDTFLKLDNC